MNIKHPASIFAIIICAATFAGAQTKERAKKNHPEKRTESCVLRLAPPTTYLANGLTLPEVEKFLGQPVSITEREEGGQKIIVQTYERGENRILIAEFIGGLLVRSHVEERQNIVPLVSTSSQNNSTCQR